MADPRIVPVSLLHKLLSLDPITGRVFWKPRTLDVFQSGRTEAYCAAWNRQWAGKCADGVIDHRGYRQTCIFNLRMLTHRVVWAMHHGKWPVLALDHISGETADNRISNLREAGFPLNSRNIARKLGASGIRGVMNRKGRWRAKGRLGGKDYHLGTFDTAEEAAQARLEWARANGFTDRHHLIDGAASGPQASSA